MREYINKTIYMQKIDNHLKDVLTYNLKYFSNFSKNRDWYFNLWCLNIVEYKIGSVRWYPVPLH